MTPYKQGENQGTTFSPGRTEMITITTVTQKKCLKITKGQSDAKIRRTDNIVANKTNNGGQHTTNKTKNRATRTPMKQG